MDLPLAESPVNQRVKPFWPRRALRSGWVTEEWCHVMLLVGRMSVGVGVKRGGGVRTYVAIIVVGERELEGSLIVREEGERLRCRKYLGLKTG